MPENNSSGGKALFIGLTYIDVTIPTDKIPQGDDKAIAETYDVGIGGNATVAAITNQKLGGGTALITPLAADFLGQVVAKKYHHYGIEIHPRSVQKTSLSLVLPNDNKRAILRCRNTDYLAPYPDVPIEDIDLLHVDGHQPDAALHYAKKCREKGILTSLDGGGLKEGVTDILNYIDVAVVSLRLCEQLEKTPEESLQWLWETYKNPVAAVTLGEDGLIYRLDGGDVHHIPALKVAPEKIRDTTGAGDVFHGAYIASYLKDASKGWDAHFKYARAASTVSIQRLGTEASTPTPEDIEKLMA